MSDRHLRFGIFLAPFHALRENPTLAIERDMDLLVHLDKLNYHEAWVGEHHSGGFEIIACPEMFIAAAAERTKHIRLGTGVVSLPYHNPFTVASRMMLLDHMTRGRAMFGVGPGSLVYDAVKMGLNPADQRRKLEQSLDVIMELMQGRTVTRKTDWFDLQEAQLQLVSYSRPMMEMAVANSRSPVGAVAAGKPTDRSKWRIVTFAHVATSREQARKDVEFGLADFARYFTDVATFPIIPAGIENPCDYLIDEGLACIGTPDDCIRHFERLWQGSNGGFGAVLLLAHNWADWAETQRSYELMARYVHPHFQRGANTMRIHSYDDAKGKHETAGKESQQAIQTEIDRYQARKGS